MNFRNKGVAVAACIALGGCNVFTYPDGPKLATSNPYPVVTLQDAMKAAHDLEVSYLDAAGEQIMVDKLVKLTFLASAGTAIGAALYGAHRDVVTGAAFAGGVGYAGSTLFGSAGQRAVYRTGAQALSCAIAKVIPLAIVDRDKLQDAYDAIADKSKGFSSALVRLEDAIDSVAVPDLSAGFAAYQAERAKVDAAIVAAAGAVATAVADDTGNSDKAARDKLRDANKVLASYMLVAASAKAHNKTLKETAARAAVNNVRDALDALDPGGNAWKIARVNEARAEVNRVEGQIGAYETARAYFVETVITGYTNVAKASISLEAWRLLPPLASRDRLAALQLLKNLDSAGGTLFSTAKNIHIKVVSQLERLEPSREEILGAMSSMIGLGLTNAKAITDARDADYPRTQGANMDPPPADPAVGGGPGGGGAGPVLGGLPPGRGGVAVVPPPAAPADADTWRAAIDAAKTGLPDGAKFAADAAALRASGAQIKSGIDTLDSEYATVRQAVGALNDAHDDIADQLAVIDTVDLTNIETECEAKINSGVETLEPSTNSIEIKPADSNGKLVQVYGGLQPYTRNFDKPLVGVTVDGGFDGTSGAYRYVIKPAAGIDDDTFVMTIRDRSKQSKTVTITTKK